MSDIRKIAAILVSDVVGCRLAGADEDRTLARRLRALRSDLIDPTISVHRGRIVKRTGDGSVIEFRASSTRCAAPSKCSMPWSSATRVLRPTNVWSFASASTSATSSRRARRRSHGRRRQHRRAAGRRLRSRARYAFPRTPSTGR